MLSKEKCEYFKNFNLKLIQVTVDGLAETHNKSRLHKNGINTFDTIITNIDHAMNELPNCKFSIRVNINKNNQDDYALLRDQLKTRWGDKNYVVYHSYVDTLGNCDQNCFTNSNKINFIKDLFEKHKIKDINIYPSHRIGGCGANYINSFVIGPDGSLYKCWADIGKTNKRIGVVSNKDTENSALLSKYMLKSDKYSDSKCEKCFLFPVCDGGCSLKRFENRFENKNNNICPYSPKDIEILLELHRKTKMQSIKI